MMFGGVPVFGGFVHKKFFQLSQSKLVALLAQARRSR
jgi:hypothetical protein